MNALENRTMALRHNVNMSKNPCTHNTQDKIALGALLANIVSIVGYGLMSFVFERDWQFFFSNTIVVVLCECTLLLLIKYR